MSAAEALYESLRRLQEPKGFFFNHDRDMTIPLLESLLANKERFGHMACPCRLAAGDFQADRDIICPCVYREADVAEYGLCYCGLYVSKAFNDEKREFSPIPERRPPDKIVDLI